MFNDRRPRPDRRMHSIDQDRIYIHENGIILDTDVGVLPVKGAAVAGLAGRVLLAVSSATKDSPIGFAKGEVLARLTTEEAADASGLLELFEHAGLVSDCAITRFELPRSNAVRDARVAIVGSGAWAVNVRAKLADAGLSVLTCADSCDLMVVAADAEDPEAHRRHAAEACARDIQVLHGTLARGEVLLGPLFRKGLGACWSCMRDRRIASDPYSAALYRLDRHRRVRPIVGRDVGLAGHIAADLLALETIRILRYGSNALLGRVCVFNLIALTTTTHLVIPLPECDVCGGGGVITDPSRYRLNLADIADTAFPIVDFPGWVDGTMGVINRAWVDEEGESTGLYFARARPVTLPGPDAELLCPAEVCSGKGVSRREALRSALGEALERYGAGQVPHARVVAAELSALDGSVLTPEAIGLYGDMQYASVDFPFERFDPHRRYHWIRGELLPSSEPIWLPAETALFGTRSLGDRLCQVTTSGLALGRDRDDAVIRAVLELVERDATMMTWLCRLPGVRLAADCKDPAVCAIIRWLESLGVMPSFYLLEVGIPIPTVLALSFGDGVCWPGLCVGSAAHPSPRKALRAAALEMVATGRSLVRVRDQLAEGDEIRSDHFIDHALYYVDPARASSASFLGDGTPKPCASYPDIAAESVHELAALLGDATDARIAVVDLTPPDLALSGLRVVRAFSDGLLPIHCGQDFERLGSRRLAGLGPLNPDPHPFC
jgi:ribosomal protein S12 methylthiotransferase accessory factor